MELSGMKIHMHEVLRQFNRGIRVGHTAWGFIEVMNLYRLINYSGLFFHAKHESVRIASPCAGSLQSVLNAVHQLHEVDPEV